MLWGSGADVAGLPDVGYRRRPRRCTLVLRAFCTDPWNPDADPTRPVRANDRSVPESATGLAGVQLLPARDGQPGMGHPDSRLRRLDHISQGRQHGRPRRHGNPVPRADLRGHAPATRLSARRLLVYSGLAFVLLIAVGTQTRGGLIARHHRYCTRLLVRANRTQTGIGRSWGAVGALHCCGGARRQLRARTTGAVCSPVRRQHHQPLFFRVRRRRTVR